MVMPHSEVTLLNFEVVPGVPFLNFQRSPGVPLLNYSGVPDPTFKLWWEGAPDRRVPRSWVLASWSNFYTMLQKMRLVKEVLPNFARINLIFWCLVLPLYRYCGDNVKCGPLSKHFFQRTQQHGGWKSPQNNNKLFKK